MFQKQLQQTYREPKLVLYTGTVQTGGGLASAAMGPFYARGYVVPDSFTHGTSAQRSKWFRRGLETGDLAIARSLFEVPDGEL